MSDNEYYDEDDYDDDEQPTTVEIVYPLKNRWTLYDHTKSDSETYDASTRKIAVINSLVKFWNVINSYPKPSQLFNNGLCKPTMGSKEISSISFFKENILPKWEDPSNSKGAEFSKRKFFNVSELDSDWTNLLVACVGNQLDSSVTGIRIVDSSAPSKSGVYKLLFRIELWYDNIDKTEKIREEFKKLLNLDNESIHFKLHQIH